MAEKLEIQIVASDDTKGAVTSASASLKGLAGAAAGVVAAKVGFDVLKTSILGSIDAANESAAISAQTAAVIASTGQAAGLSADEIGNMASALSKSVPIDDEVIQSAENMLLTFTNIGKDVFPQATKTVLDMSVALGQDTKSSAIQLGKALNDPINGLTALQRVGVTFTDAQKEQIKAMQEAGDVAGAQGVILQELQREFGGSAEAAGKTFGGQLTILKTQLGNVQEAIGTALIPVIARLLEFVMRLVGFFQGLPQPVQLAIAAFAGVAVAVAGLAAVFAPLIGAVTTVLPILGAIAAVLSGPIILAVAAVIAVIAGLVIAWKTDFLGIQEITASVLDTIQSAWNTVWPAIQAVVEAVWPVISAIITTYIAAVRLEIEVALAAIQAIWSVVWPVVQAVVEAVWPVIQAVVSVAIQAVRTDIEVALAAIQAVWSVVWPAAQAIIETVWPIVKQVVTDNINAARSSIEVAIAAIKLAWSWWETMSSVVSSAFETVKTTVSGGIATVRGYFDGASTWLIQAGRDIVMGLVNGIQGAVESAAQAAANLAKRVKDAAMSALGISSPSTVFYEIGQQTAQGYINGLLSMSGAIQGTVAGVFGAISGGPSASYSGGGQGYAEGAAIGTPGAPPYYGNNMSPGMEASGNRTTVYGRGGQTIVMQYNGRELARQTLYTAGDLVFLRMTPYRGF